MKRILLISALFWIVALPGKASDCSTAFVCDMVNYQRMFLDGRLLELPKKPFSFRLQGNELFPQQGASPLGDGTLGYEVNTLELCDTDGKLKKNSRNNNYQFEGRNSLYKLEYLNGQLLVSAHKHHEHFDLTSAQCREL